MTTSERSVSIEIPAFIDELVAKAGAFDSALARMRLAIRLSEANVEHGGGPFGAAVFAGPQLIAAGVNCVLSSGFSIAHAEIVALMRAQQVLHKAGDGASVPAGPYTLVTSAEPCCQCFGALVWSGMHELACGATRADVEAIGFDEGPKPDGWADVLRAKGIAVTEEVCRSEAGVALARYAERGGPIYGLRHPLVP